MHENDIINSTLLFIKEHTGLALLLDERFCGLQYHNKRVFFNVEIEEPCFESAEFERLLKISGSYRVVKSVEPNGYKRLAVFVT